MIIDCSFSHSMPDKSNRFCITFFADHLCLTDLLINKQIYNTKSGSPSSAITRLSVYCCTAWDWILNFFAIQYFLFNVCQLMCSEDDLKSIGLPLGPRKKILKFVADREKSAAAKTEQVQSLVAEPLTESQLVQPVIPELNRTHSWWDILQISIDWAIFCSSWNNHSSWSIFWVYW